MDTLPPATQGHISNHWHCTKLHISNHRTLSPHNHILPLQTLRKPAPDFAKYRFLGKGNVFVALLVVVRRQHFFSQCIFSALRSEGTLSSRKNIDYFTRRERMFTQRFCCRECKYKMEIRSGDWQMLGAVLTLGLRRWPGTSEDIWGPTLQPAHFWPTDPKTRVKKQRGDWQTFASVLTQGLRHWLAISRLTSWRMTWEHWRPAALTNDFDGTEDKMFAVWRLKQFICFIDLQYKGKEIIEH